MFSTYPIVLRDTDEIEAFFMDSTGMLPGYTQLSRGLADLRIRTVELKGVTLIWTRARGRARWRDQMTGDGLHIGFAIDSSGPIRAQGQDIGPDDAQIWIPGLEMDLIIEGPNLTLDIGVDEKLVNERGWSVQPPPLRKVSPRLRRQLINQCVQATDLVRGSVDSSNLSNRTEPIDLRDRILSDLEMVISPWLKDNHQIEFSCSNQYKLLREADSYFKERGLSEPFSIDELVEWLGVPRRTVFHAFKTVLGVSPRRYLEIQRLHALRSQLRQTSYLNSTVSDLAIQLGFSDMGRMASVYQLHFDEKPSDTLRFS